MRNTLTAFALGGALLAAAPAAAVSISSTSVTGGNTVTPFETSSSQISVDFGINAFQPISLGFTVEAGDAAIYNFDSAIDVFTGIGPLARGVSFLTLALTGGATFGLGDVTSFSSSTFSLNATRDLLSISFSPAETNSVQLGSLNGTAGDFTIDRGSLAAGSSFGLTVAPGPVPEPATWAMMVLGFGLLGATLRRRRAADTVTA